MGKYIVDWDSPYVRSCRHEYSERYGDGLYCVYFWEDDGHEVFYVGSGKGYRFNDVSPKSRSAEFMERYNSCDNPRPRIVAYGMTKEESRLFEMRLIRAFMILEFPLVNKEGVTRPYGRTVTYKGRTRTYGAWGKDIGVTGGTIKARIEKLGWSLEKALFTPSEQDLVHQRMREHKVKEGAMDNG